MQITSSQNFLNYKDCKFTLNGENVANLRRIKLRKIALALKIDADPDEPKHTLLPKIIGRLNAMHAEPELADWADGL